ncbi:hypothetical protein AT15_09735 [Kosmotoga arenicorallina S304]|uniref:WYL domain-containing protein n=1 Tax=Kosmotoga arenicorallina S304 TaxID=1453497 RepID=A0A176K1C2_9BACT|nr:hypothetical protein [Kosmotoga arenicorallina]OAA30699.1 hypothetical protein AT15_09735 [Kosmotoga arenicorallina S304]
MTLAFRISTRQAEREIEYLRRVFHAPLKYSRKYGGYYYAEPFEFPLLFGPSAGMRKKNPVVSVIEGAISRKEKLFVKLPEHSGIFIPYYYSASREGFVGRFENSKKILEIKLKELKLLKTIDKHHTEVPVFNLEKSFPTEIRVARIKKNSETLLLVYEKPLDIVKWLLENKKVNFEIISPKKLIKELLSISRVIEKTIKAGSS